MVINKNYNKGENRKVRPKLWRLLNIKKKAIVKYKSVLCPDCIAIAFTEDTPKYITEGYCYRCGTHLKWEWEK